MKNVIIFHTDQQRYDSLGCNGNTNAVTPNIDNLANDGCNFSRHISTNPVCMPSRASLLTGMYVNGHGVCSNGVPLWRRDNGCEDKNNATSQAIFGCDVENKIPTIADILGENGYNTALFGKLHVNPLLADKSYGFYECYEKWEEEETENIDTPFYGFQYYRMVNGHGEAPCTYTGGHYGRWLIKNYPEVAKMVQDHVGIVKPEGVTRGDIYKSKIPANLHNSTWIANESCKYLDMHKDDEKPFFMFVGFPDPHHAFTPPEEVADKFDNIPLPKFTTMDDIKTKPVSAMQDGLNRISATKGDIEAAYRLTQASINLIDTSIGKVIAKLKEQNKYDDTIIIFTADHGEMLGDYGCLAKMDNPFYSLLHIPFIIKGTKDETLPHSYEKPMSNADVLPTILSMVNVKGGKGIQGVDIFSDKAKGNMPITTCNNILGENRSMSIFDERYRYTYYIATGEEELYDQIEDVHELENLAVSQPEKYKDICATMREEAFKKHLNSNIGIYNHYGLW